MMYKGFFGCMIVSTVKWGLTVMIMYLALYVSYIIGYYDAPDFSTATAVGLTDLAGNLLSTDLSYYGIEHLSFLGVLGTVLSVVIELCFRLCNTEFSVSSALSDIALYSIIAVIMTTIVISVSTKLYLKMASRLNRRCSKGFWGFCNVVNDIVCVMIIVYTGLICTGCLTRRALILTAGLPNWLIFTIYIMLLLAISALMAVLDAKLNTASKGFSVFINTALEMLYSVLISAESLCISAIILILTSINSNAWTDAHMQMFGLMLFFAIGLILTIYLANRKKSD